MYRHEISTKIKSFYLQLIDKRFQYEPSFVTIYADNKGDIYKIQQLYSISTFILDDKDKEFYDGILLQAMYNGSIAFELYDLKFYINEEDKERLYQAVIRNTDQNLDVLRQNQVSSFFHNRQDLNTYIINSLSYNVSLNDLLVFYPQYIDEEIWDVVIKLLRIEDDIVQIGILLRMSNEKYAVKLLKTLFTEKNYLSIYNTCIDDYRYKNNKIIRQLCFNYIIDKYEKISSLIKVVPSLLNEGTETELIVIYRKFHNYMFIYKTFKEYYNYCLIFGKWLNEHEKEQLIQHIGTKSRIKYIDKAIQKINFNDKEFKQLQALQLIESMK